VPIDGDGEARLNAFIEWAFLQGIAQPRLADFRRVAVDLVEMAGAGRVTESHILALLAQVADSADSRELGALIEEVGESWLRFQASRRASGPVPAQRVGRTPSGSGPFVARPEQRVAGELRPPVVTPAPGDVPPPTRISFATGSQPPPTPRATPRSIPARRRSTTHFRCLRCKVMVVADASGLCPRCGTAAPRVASAQIATLPAGAPTRWLLPAALLVVVVVGAATLGPHIVDRLRHPSESASGDFRSSHLGLRLAFPADWRHAREDDRAPTGRLETLAPVFSDALSLRSARFYRGGLSADPDAELVLVVGARASTVSDGALEAWGRSAAATPATLADPVRGLTGVAGLDLYSCAFGAAQPKGGLRCSGAVGHIRAELFVWGAAGTVELALFLSRQGPEPTAAEAAELVSGLDRGG
jgi:hypothetical protein